MTEFTLENLKTLLREAVGGDESLNLDGDILDTDFVDLGFDSLAIIDTTSKIQQRYGVTLPEGATQSASPRELLDLVRDTLARTAA